MLTSFMKNGFLHSPHRYKIPKFNKTGGIVFFHISLGLSSSPGSCERRIIMSYRKELEGCLTQVDCELKGTMNDH